MRFFPLLTVVIPLVILAHHTATAQWWRPTTAKPRTVCAWRGKTPYCHWESYCRPGEWEAETSEEQDERDRQDGYIDGWCRIGFRRKCCKTIIPPTPPPKVYTPHCRVTGRPQCTTEECRPDEVERGNNNDKCTTPGTKRLICCERKHMLSVKADRELQVWRDKLNSLPIYPNCGPKLCASTTALP